MFNCKKSIYKICILIIFILIGSIILFNNIINTSKSNSKNIAECSDCKKWQASHEGKDLCIQIVWKCPTCGKDRFCG